MKRFLSKYNLVRLVGVVLLVLALLVGGIGFFTQHPRAEPSDFIADFYANLSSEFAGIALTILIIDYLNERRDDQRRRAQLIREMGSSNNAIALRAVAELRAEKWLFDGSLRLGSFIEADLANGSLNER